MNTFSLAALMIIYLTFENPDLFLSERGMAFNMRGFRAMLDEAVQKKDYHILGFVIMNYMYERSIYGSSQTDEGIARISRVLRQTFPECSPFYLRNGRFALVGSEKLDWEKIRGQVQYLLNQENGSGEGSIYANVGFAEISPQSSLDTADRISNI